MHGWQLQKKLWLYRSGLLLQFAVLYHLKVLVLCIFFIVLNVPAGDFCTTLTRITYTWRFTMVWQIALTMWFILPHIEMTIWTFQIRQSHQKIVSVWQVSYKSLSYTNEVSERGKTLKNLSYTFLVFFVRLVEVENNLPKCSKLKIFEFL